jgi:hypothetical protein
MKKLLAFFAFALLAFSAHAAPTATLTWIAPTTYSDGTPIPSTVTLTYNIYQGTSATTLVQVATGVTALTNAISTGLTDGQTYYFAVTAVANGLEGAKSNVGSKTFPAVAPGTVTLTVT